MDTWLVQPTVLTFMKYDYSLLQSKIFLSVIEKLQFAIKEAYEHFVTTENDNASSISLFSEDKYQSINDRNKISLAFKISDFGVRACQYAQLKDALRTISDVPVEIPSFDAKGREWIYYKHLCEVVMPKTVKYKDDFIYILFDKVTANHMLRMSSGYTKFLKRTIQMSKNSYTPRFIVLLSLYKYSPKQSIKMTSLRSILCLEKKYENFCDFKKRVLTAAEDDIKRMADEGISDFWFEWFPMYNPGRRKAGEPDMIKFVIHTKESQIEEDKDLNARKSCVYNELRSQYINLPESQASAIRERITLDNFNDIQNKIMEVFDIMNKKEIKNRAEYMYVSLVDILDFNTSESYSPQSDLLQISKEFD